MALQGNFVWKGIQINEAYIVVKDAFCSCSYQNKAELKTEATYNEDGTIKDPAVYEESIEKRLDGTYTASIYKDKASKDADPFSPVDEITGIYTPKHTSSAKNDVAQAYAALKVTDACKDLADA
tara:strand:+ start:1199 stop:1570 length:372 start_codon:yes stop_codon:yes gene_type:complete